MKHFMNPSTKNPRHRSTYPAGKDLRADTSKGKRRGAGLLPVSFCPHIMWCSRHSVAVQEADVQKLPFKFRFRFPFTSKLQSQGGGAIDQSIGLQSPGLEIHSIARYTMLDLLLHFNRLNCLRCNTTLRFLARTNHRCPPRCWRRRRDPDHTWPWSSTVVGSWSRRRTVSSPPRGYRPAIQS